VKKRREGKAGENYLKMKQTIKHVSTNSSKANFGTIFLDWRKLRTYRIE
jgi:hypothetical protein